MADPTQPVEEATEAASAATEQSMETADAAAAAAAAAAKAEKVLKAKAVKAARAKAARAAKAAAAVEAAAAVTAAAEADAAAEIVSEGTPTPAPDMSAAATVAPEATAAPAASAPALADSASAPEPADASATAIATEGEDAASEAPEGARRESIPLEEKVARGEAAAERLLALLGVKATGISGHVDGEQVVLQVEEIESPAELDNRAYEALQFMLNKAINRGAARRTRLSLQTDGFRGRRADGLGRVAAHLSHKARKLGVTLSVGPLGANDLRALTVQLNRQKGLQLESTGEGELRRLVISSTEAVEVTADGAADGGPRRKRRRKRRRG